MRPIKFRVWDTRLKHFLPNVEWNLLGNEEYVFQQFTGLKDAAGKDICEGDIVAVSPAAFEQTRITDNVYEVHHDKPLPNIDIILAKGVVGWNEQFCSFNITYIEQCEAWKGDGASGTQLVLYRYGYEVIGNIFENPELLETNPTKDS